MKPKKIMLEISKKQFDSLKIVLEYIFDTEGEDYEEQREVGNIDHVYRHAEIVFPILKKKGKTK